ncbi:MAG: diguanylate cyclase [Dehalococcoidia bacterium]|jgi:hypothetical protein
MPANRLHNHLRLLGPSIKLVPDAVANVIALPSRRKLATRDELLGRLEAIGEIAPDAPLSFLVVNVVGACHGDHDDQLRRIANRMTDLVRGTDLAGRMNGHVFGIVLQGTGVVAAGAVAARLTHHLNRIAELSPSLCITVSAATGTGMNAGTLAVAAMETCCGQG